MTRRQRYFVKQRLMGILMMLGTALAGRIVPEALIAAVFTVPMGLTCLLSKQMVWTDKYYYEVKYGEETR